jgi:hypothetical protein
MDYTNGIISDYGDHRSGRDAAQRVSSAVRFNKALAGDVYGMQTAIYEYPDFILNYAACNNNGHGVGDRAQGMRY